MTEHNLTTSVAKFLECLTATNLVAEPPEVFQQPERRAASRYRARLAACVQRLDITLSPVGMQQNYETRTISRDGLSLVSDHPIELGTHLYITVEGPGSSIDVIAFVRQCSPCGGKFRVGVEFIFDEFDALVARKEFQ
jgi:hypothetical protein